MKTICWIRTEGTIVFKVNWFEFIILKRVFKQKRYKVMKRSKALIGRKVDVVIYDEI